MALRRTIGALVMLVLLGVIGYGMVRIDRAVFGSDGGPTTSTPTGTTQTRPKKRLLLIEGLAVRDIVRKVGKVGIAGAGYAAAATHATPPTGFLGPGERAATIEGFLFPATYDVPQPSTGANLVAQQLKAFSAAFKGVDLSYATSRKLTAYDVLKIASMIEREAVAPADRATIAAVIYNRLKARMPLGIDSTIEYASGHWTTPTAPELRLVSPFNSRTHRGLPPTPICNPGLASLEAAAHPAKVSYLYFYAIPGNKAGKMFFATDYATFLAFIAKHPG